MSLWVIIPVKPLNRAKSRLAEVLSPEQRLRFAELLLRRVLTVVKAVPQVTGTLVISRDTKALAIARELGAKTLQESNGSDLNPALERATEIVRVWGGSAVLVLPADLPFISSSDVEHIAEMGRFGTQLVIATDKERDGTNALLVRPAGLVSYAYGKGSYVRHVAAAKAAGADVKTYVSEGIELDIDLPDDLAEYNRRLEAQEIDLLIPFLPDLTA